MTRIAIVALTWAALLIASLAGAATQVQRTIPFDEGAGGSEKVRSECQIQTRVPTAVKEFAADVELVDALDKKGRALELSIMEVHAPGGGVFSGPKWMAVYGKLYEKGKMVGSFRAKRLSTGANLRGTCATLARCAQAIGEDIAQWLQAPSMDAELGDAR